MENILYQIDTPLEGVVTVPGSKSMTNRALLLATLSEEESVLRGVLSVMIPDIFSLSSKSWLLLEVDENEKLLKSKEQAAEFHIRQEQ